MASKEIEREIDNWCEHTPLKRRSMMNRTFVQKGMKYYDRLWNKTVKDMFKQENTLYLPE